MSVAQIITFLKRVKNEVPAATAVALGAITAVLTVLETLPPEATVVGAVGTVLLALVRQFVSPAFPEGAQKAVEVAARAEVVALKQLAGEGDATAQEVLDLLAANEPSVL